jgi:hypothetical protein
LVYESKNQSHALILSPITHVDIILKIMSHGSEKKNLYVGGSTAKSFGKKTCIITSEKISATKNEKQWTYFSVLLPTYSYAIVVPVVLSTKCLLAFVTITRYHDDIQYQ